jgi:starch phosphorylase
MSGFLRETVTAVAFDTPITGWRGQHVNTLRRWSARAADPIRLEDFNRGDHVGALADRVRLEAISRVLYPSDDTPAGQDLRLRQEFFFASASLQDLVRRHKQQHGELSSLPDHVAIQLNDTHPAIAVPELMRLLVDLHGMPWDLAWSITTAVFNYTNHAAPEALETWSVALLEQMLPRHMQIIANQRAPPDAQRARAALIPRFWRRFRWSRGTTDTCGWAISPSRRTSPGSSALHTDRMRSKVPDLHSSIPTASSTRPTASRSGAGSTRRTRTHALIVDAIGRGSDDADALEGWRRWRRTPLRERSRLRRDNKVALARLVAERTGSASTRMRCSTFTSSASTNTSGSC